MLIVEDFVVLHVVKNVYWKLLHIHVPGLEISRQRELLVSY